MFVAKSSLRTPDGLSPGGCGGLGTRLGMVWVQGFGTAMFMNEFQGTMSRSSSLTHVRSHTSEALPAPPSSRVCPRPQKTERPVEPVEPVEPGETGEE